MPLMKRTIIYRIGDRVRLIDPRPIIRIGYDVTPESLYPEVVQDSDVQDFIVKQNLTHKMAVKVYWAVAISRVRRQMKGGNERKVILGDPIEQYGDMIYTILDKKVRYTGVYDPGYSGYDYYGEYDYDPPSLCNVEAHVCLCLNPFWVIAQDRAPEWSDGLWVTSDQVEKVNTQSDTELVHSESVS